MSDDHPHLTLVDPNYSTHDDEFIPLPAYPWNERPNALPLTHDEAATAIYLSHGDTQAAALLLRVPFIRLNRLLRQSPRLQTILRESLDEVLARAVSLPISTLFSPDSNQRAKEWAASTVLKSKLAANHPLAPNPAGAQAQSLTVSQADREIVFRWRSPTDDAQTIDSSYDKDDDAAHE
jgi:hypothetical protein